MTGWFVGCLALVVAGLPAGTAHATVGVDTRAAGSAAVGPTATSHPPVVPGGAHRQRPGPLRLMHLGAPFAPSVPPGVTGPTGPMRDRWLAEDKVRHFTASFAATGMAYGAVRTVAPPRDARIGAVALAAVLGVGKELVDARGGGTFSLKDLAWDAAGVALGYTFVQRME